MNLEGPIYGKKREERESVVVPEESAILFGKTKRRGMSYPKGNKDRSEGKWTLFDYDYLSVKTQIYISRNKFLVKIFFP